MKRPKHLGQPSRLQVSWITEPITPTGQLMLCIWVCSAKANGCSTKWKFFRTALARTLSPGDNVRARSVRKNFHFVEQTFAFAEQTHLHNINRPVGVIGSVIHDTCSLDGCPRCFGRFITVCPVVGEPMVAADVNQFKTAATSISPLTPAATF